MKISSAFLVLPVVAMIATGPGFGRSREQFLLEDGTELYTAQKYEEAIQQFEEIIKIDPANYRANYLIAVSYLALYHPASDDPKDQEYTEKGLAAFKRTLDLPSPDADERAKTENFYLSFLDSAGDRDTAIAYLEKQLASRPSDLALINQIAALYQKKGDFTKALEYYEKRTSLDANNKEAWYTLGVKCWDRSYHGGPAVSQEQREMVIDKGIAALDSALKIDPDYFDALAYINLLYREKAKALVTVGRDAEASEAFATADEFQKRAFDVRKQLTSAARAN